MFCGFVLLHPSGVFCPDTSLDSSSFNVSVPFHPVWSPLLSLNILQNVRHRSPASYDCVKMRNGTKDDSVRSELTSNRSRCVFVLGVTSCNCLLANINVWSLVVSVDVVMDRLLKWNFIYCFILFSKNAELGGYDFN